MERNMPEGSKKRLSFKDFLSVDYRPGDTEQEKLNAKKRKKDASASALTGESTDLDLDEVLSYSARRSKARSLKKNKARIKHGQRKQARKMADGDRLKDRAQRQARNSIFRKLSGGKSRGDVSIGKRMSIEKRLNKMSSKISRIAKKSLPTVRKQEISRRNSRGRN